MTHTTPQPAPTQTAPSVGQPSAEQVVPPPSTPSTLTSPSTEKKRTATQAAQPAPSATSTTTGTGPAKTTAGQPAAYGFVINIQAREDSWTVITADGRTVFSGLLAAGDERSIRGQKEVIVRAGNSGGVDLYFNGNKIPQIGQYGEIHTVTFTSSGLIPTMPTPSTAH